MVIFSIQFCGCTIKLTKDDVKDDSKEVVGSNSSTDINITQNMIMNSLIHLMWITLINTPGIYL